MESYPISMYVYVFTYDTYIYKCKYMCIYIYTLHDNMCMYIYIYIFIYISSSPDQRIRISCWQLFALVRLEYGPSIWASPSYCFFTWVLIWYRRGREGFQTRGPWQGPVVRIFGTRSFSIMGYLWAVYAIHRVSYGQVLQV